MKEINGVLIQRERGLQPVSTRILTEMEEDENERASRKKCGLCRQHGHSRNNCPNVSSS